MGNIWPYRWALYLHFLIKLPRCVFLRSPLYISQGSGRSGWIRCPHGLGRPAPWAPSRPDGTGSPAWARWLSLRARREKKKRERERESERERETVKEKKWGRWASSRGRHSNRCELTAGGSCQGDGRFPPRCRLPPRPNRGSLLVPGCGQAIHRREMRSRVSWEQNYISPYLASINQPVNRSIICLYTCAVSSTNHHPVGYHPPH